MHLQLIYIKRKLWDHDIKEIVWAPDWPKGARVETTPIQNLETSQMRMLTHRAPDSSELE